MMPPPDDDTPPATWGLAAFLVLAAAAFHDQTAARAKALAPILVRVRNGDLAWARLRAVLEASGVLGSRHDHDPPRLARGAIHALYAVRSETWEALAAPVRLALVPASEALVISP
jgi:hypothetical protein